MYANITNQGIIVLGRIIPFWVICLILLIYILYLKLEKVKGFINKSLSLVSTSFIFLALETKRLWNWINTGEAYIKIKSLMINLFTRFRLFLRLPNTPKAKTDHALRQLYVAIVFVIAMFILFNYILISEVYSRNVPEQIKSTFLLITLLVILALWFILTLISSGGFYIKSLFLWFLMGFPLFLIYNFHNTISKVIGISILALTLIFYPFAIKKEKNPRIWLWVTLLIMIISLFAGIALIDSIYGSQPPVILSLNINGNVSTKYADGQGKIYCIPSNQKEEFTLGDNLTCIVKPDLNLLKVNLIVTLESNHTYSIDLSNNSYRFLTENKTTYLYFEIVAKDKKGRDLFLSTGKNPEFEKYYTIEQQKQRRQDFVKYLGILFTAIFISIPVMMYYLRELSKRKTLETF